MRIFALGVLILWICGCAATGQPREQPEWQCRAEADNAVARGDWRSAHRMHQAIVDQAPDNCLAHYHLGYIAGQLGDRAAEATHYEDALTCGYEDDDQLLFNLGMAYGELDRLPDAAAAFERAVALNDGNPENHYGLGLMLEKQGRLDLARASFSRALAIDPRHWESRLALCRILLDQGRLASARPHLEALVTQMPDDPKVRELLHLYQRRRSVFEDR